MTDKLIRVNLKTKEHLDPDLYAFLKPIPPRKRCEALRHLFKVGMSVMNGRQVDVQEEHKLLSHIGGSNNVDNKKKKWSQTDSNNEDKNFAVKISLPESELGGLLD